MLAVTSVIVEKCVSNICFLSFYILQAAPPKRHGASGNFSPTLSFDGRGCVNNALISALKKLTL